MNRPTYISLIALALLLGGAWSAPAQGPISLDEYRERVLDYSYTLKMARENRAAAEAGVRQSYTGFLPALSAAGDFSVNFKDRYAVSNGASQLLHPYAFSLQPALARLLVMMIRVFLKSTIRPWPSVKRPSSSTWSSTLNTSG